MITSSDAGSATFGLSFDTRNRETFDSCLASVGSVINEQLAVLFELRMECKSQQAFFVLIVGVDAAFIDVQEDRCFFSFLIVFEKTLTMPSCSATNTRSLPSPA